VGLGDLDKILVKESMVSLLGWSGNEVGSDLVKTELESWELERLNSSPWSISMGTNRSAVANRGDAR
jgi:hypothetical protein